jgi:hypothetical protein
MDLQHCLHWLHLEPTHLLHYWLHYEPTHLDHQLQPVVKLVDELMHMLIVARKHLEY